MPDTQQIITVSLALVIVGALFIPLVQTVDSNSGETQVVNESVTADVGNYVDLDGYDIVSGSVTVYNSTGDVQTEDSDYEIGYDNGSIKAVSGGDITDGNTIQVTYNYSQTSGTVTTVANLIPLMILVAVLAFVAFAVREATGGF